MDDSLNSKGYEEFESILMELATAAQSVDEIETLKRLTKQAHDVLYPKYDYELEQPDTKWQQLCELLQDPEINITGEVSENEVPRKLIIFTEHKDTLDYLQEQIENFLGNKSGTVVVIHGVVAMSDRKVVQANFRNSPEVRVLIAIDAAGEGVNLQNANWMINYDLSWNPNRIEQRIGRIHRIGQR